MKKSWLTKLLFATIAVTNLSACIVRPWPDEDERRHHRGEYHEHHGEHHEDHGEYYEHY
jgi:hypothetical protein